MNQLVPFTASRVPELVAAAGERASMRFLEFFAANIRNPHTRPAYARAADEFLAWCSSAGVPATGPPKGLGRDDGPRYGFSTPHLGPTAIPSGVHALRCRCVCPQQAFVFQLRP
jgi:hypothetical protein